MSCTVQWRKVTCEGGSSPWPCQGKLWVSWCPRLLKNACMPMQVLGGGGESLGQGRICRQSRMCTFKVVDAHKLVVSCSNIWSFLHLTVSADITDWCNLPLPLFRLFPVHYLEEVINQTRRWLEFIKLVKFIQTTQMIYFQDLQKYKKIYLVGSDRYLRLDGIFCNKRTSEKGDVLVSEQNW